jgi:hypothetical protein
VDRALAVCKAAGRDKDSQQLQLARNSLASHIESAKRHATRPKRAKPGPAELTELLKQGDSQCPQGMAYNIEGTDKQIKCTGLQPIRMSWQKARDYYSKLGFHVTTSEAPPSVRAEHGSELYVFTFSRTDDPQPPRCLTIYPEPGLPWQEAVARATGTPLPRLKPAGPVPTAEGNIALRIDEGKDKLIVYLGDCNHR